MDEKPDQIIGHIEAQREELGRNLNELETRVRRSTDWRTYYDRNPMMILGAALGSGILLGSMVGGKTRSRKRRKSYSGSSQSSMTAGIMGGALAGASSSSGSQTGSETGSQSNFGSSSSSTRRRPAGPATSIQKSRINETMDHIKAALISFGIAKSREFLSQAIPGLDQHLEEAERSKREHHSNLSGSMQGHSGGDFRTHTESNYRTGSGYGSASDYRAPEAVGSNPPSRQQ